jgi:hypothetical protein
MEAERSEAVEDPGRTHREVDRRRESPGVATRLDGPRKTSVPRQREALQVATKIDSTASAPVFCSA